jgi:hypothetical protein
MRQHHSSEFAAVNGKLRTIDDHDETALSELIAILARARPNILLVGPGVATDHAVEMSRAHLHWPTATWSPREAQDLPPMGSYRTLIIRAADALDAAQQAELFDQLCAGPHRVQVISIASTDLFVRVARGDFLEELYYQLNHVRWELR